MRCTRRVVIPVCVCDYARNSYGMSCPIANIKDFIEDVAIDLVAVVDDWRVAA